MRGFGSTDDALALTDIGEMPDTRGAGPRVACLECRKAPSVEGSMSSNQVTPSALRPMTIEELESGLGRLEQVRTEDTAFWDENVVSFRVTVHDAIRETSEMLALSSLPLDCRIELERQKVLLQGYLKIADDDVRSRGLRQQIVRRQIGGVGN